MMVAVSSQTQMELFASLLETQMLREIPTESMKLTGLRQSLHFLPPKLITKVKVYSPDLKLTIQMQLLLLNISTMQAALPTLQVVQFTLARCGNPTGDKTLMETIIPQMDILVLDLMNLVLQLDTWTLPPALLFPWKMLPLQVLCSSLQLVWLLFYSPCSETLFKVL